MGDIGLVAMVDDTVDAVVIAVLVLHLAQWTVLIAMVSVAATALLISVLLLLLCDFSSRSRCPLHLFLL